MGTTSYFPLLITNTFIICTINHSNVRSLLAFSHTQISKVSIGCWRGITSGNQWTYWLVAHWDTLWDRLWEY